MQSRPVTKFTEDFDFMAMNEKFKKDEVWGHLGKNNKTREGNGEISDEDDTQNEYDIGLAKIEKVRFPMLRVSMEWNWILFKQGACIMDLLISICWVRLFFCSLYTIKMTSLILSLAMGLIMTHRMEGPGILSK